MVTREATDEWWRKACDMVPRLKAFVFDYDQLGQAVRRHEYEGRISVQAPDHATLTKLRQSPNLTDEQRRNMFTEVTDVEFKTYITDLLWLPILFRHFDNTQPCTIGSLLDPECKNWPMGLITRAEVSSNGTVTIWFRPFDNLLGYVMVWIIEVVQTYALSLQHLHDFVRPYFFEVSICEEPRRNETAVCVVHKHETDLVPLPLDKCVPFQKCALPPPPSSFCKSSDPACPTSFEMAEDFGALSAELSRVRERQPALAPEIDSLLCKMSTSSTDVEKSTILAACAALTPLVGDGTEMQKALNTFVKASSSLIQKAEALSKRVAEEEEHKKKQEAQLGPALENAVLAGVAAPTEEQKKFVTSTCSKTALSREEVMKLLEVSKPVKASQTPPGSDKMADNMKLVNPPDDKTSKGKNKSLLEELQEMQAAAKKQKTSV
jgi:hypothetical protein